MSKKILIIDDEVDVAQVLTDFLSDIGYETSLALDAREGLEMIEKDPPDLVLLDILMPQISGLECLQLIKGIHSELIVIVMSGMSDEALAKEAIQLGAYTYITKPFDLDYLENQLLKQIFCS